MHLVQCRADSVKHAASPSRCDSSQRVVMSPVIPTSVRCCRTPECPAPLRRVLQSFRIEPQPNPLAGTAPSSLPSSRTAFPEFRALVALGENLDTGQPFSYRYELRTQHRLESVATRTPPPICTSAHGPQTALVSRTAERRERFNNYQMMRF